MAGTSWDDRMTGRACARCGVRRGLRVVQRQEQWNYVRAVCIDVAACDARRDKAQQRARQRGGVLVISEAPCADPAPGACRWCGEPIGFVEGVDHRRKRRERHYGDEFEVPGSPECRAAYHASFTWEPREAVRARELAAHSMVACVDCGAGCEDETGHRGWDVPAWEADHEMALEDGGEHVLDNLRCRCVPCHRSKTAREAAARAQR